MIDGYRYYVDNIAECLGKRRFKGWGRKRTGRFALWCHERFGGKLTLYEDGFIRSMGLGVEDAPTFSIVEDDVGIYYDATRPSKLENLLNSYDFAADEAAMAQARKAMGLIRRHRVSKYNGAPDVDDGFRMKYGMTEEEKGGRSRIKSGTPGAFLAGQMTGRVLVVAQTAGDASLRYGLADGFATGEMIDAAIAENPGAQVYLKVHPDVLSGRKRSDIDVEAAREKCTVIEEDVNPVSLLEHFDKVYTKTSQMGFEALMLGKACVCFGMPFYAGWGVTDDRAGCERRTRTRSVEEIFAAAYILCVRYCNPYTKRASDVIDTIETIARHRDTARKGGDKAYFFGFSRWKHAFVEPFFPELRPENRFFINPFFGKGHLKKALEKGLGSNSRIYVWGRRPFDEVEAFAQANNIPLCRVEDGFVRSVGLGSDLTQPWSQVVDSRGIYFDPTRESDLEHLLQTFDFASDPKLLARAASVRRRLVELKLSKYNLYAHEALDFPKGRGVILVPGQVEDDASIRFGAPGMTNLDLLRQVRRERPDACIVYKPHPDVLAGNRAGRVGREEALRYCDRIVTEASLDSVLEHADEVHTMTSLVGFEALMRGKKVTTYGLPFYAGWGLTADRHHCDRRTRQLALDELVAGALLLYPRYLDPATKRPCEVEVVLDAIAAEKKRTRHSAALMRAQKVRIYITRKLQQVCRVFNLFL